MKKSLLIKMYYDMLLIREVELRIESLYLKDEMKTPVHLSIGQEAVAVGVCSLLREQDYIFSNHRGHAHYIAKGGDLNSMIAELYNRSTGCARGRGGSMHLIDISKGHLGSSSIVGGSIPIATGSALASKLQNDDSVTVVFFGDGASEEGVFYESMNFAKLKKLPVVFVCENNFYSVCSHQSVRESTSDISKHGKAFNISSISVDGSSVLDVFKAAERLIKNCRKGNGPGLLVCNVYRWRAHSGVGDPDCDKYRIKKEHEKWIKKDPVLIFEKFLKKKKIITEEDIKMIKNEIEHKIDKAFQFAIESPLPSEEELMNYIFFKREIK